MPRKSTYSRAINRSVVQHTHTQATGNLFKLNQLTCRMLAASVLLLAPSPLLAIYSDTPGSQQLYGYDTETVTQKITGANGLKKERGTPPTTLTFTNPANDYSGETLIKGGTLKAGAAGVFSKNSLINIDAGDGILDLNGYDQTIKGLKGVGQVKLGTRTVAEKKVSGLLTIDTDSDQTYSGNIGTDGDPNTSGGLTKLGTGTLTLNGNLDNTGNMYAEGGFNAVAGNTTISAGTLKIGADGLLSSKSNISLGGMGTLDISQSTKPQVIRGLADTSDTDNGGNIKLGGQTLTTSFGGPTTFSGHLSGTGGLTIIGTGTLTLNGTNSYSGDTTISKSSERAMNVGTLKAGKDNVFSATSAVNLTDADAILDLNGTTQTIASLKGIGKVYLGGGTLTTDFASSGESDAGVTFSGVIGKDNTDTGNLIKQGTGKLILTSEKLNITTTTISGGTLQFDKLPTATSKITVTGAASTLAINNADAQTFAASKIAGTEGTFKKMGEGELTLNGAASDFAGTTLVEAGTLKFGIADAIKASVLNISATGIVDLANSNQTFAGLEGAGGELKTTATGNLTLDTAADKSFTFDGKITGAGTVTKTGTGTQIFNSADNNTTGAVTVNTGTLLIGADTAHNTAKFTSSAITVENGATLGGFGTIAAPVTVNAGGFLSPGSDTAIGTLTISDAKLTFNAGSALNYNIADSDGSGNADLIKLTGTGGTVDIKEGSKLIIIPAAGAFKAEHNYTVIRTEAENGITGTFSYDKDDPKFEMALLKVGDIQYNGNVVTFDVKLKTGDKPSSGGTPGDTPSGGASGDTPSGDASGDTPSGDASGDTPSGDASGDTPSGDASGDTPSGDASGDTPSGGASGDTPSGGASGGTPSGGASGDTPSGGASGGTPSGGASGGTPSGGASGGTPSGGASGNTPSGGASGNTPSADPLHITKDTSYDTPQTVKAGEPKIYDAKVTAPELIIDNGGSLVVGSTKEIGNNAILTSKTVDVKSGGTLAGHGTVLGDVHVEAGGNLSPGNSPGVLTIKGDFSFDKNANLIYDIVEDGSSDMVDVSGTATLKGGTLRILPKAGAWRVGRDYTVIKANQITGKFDSFTNSGEDFALLKIDGLHYSADHKQVTLSLSPKVSQQEILVNAAHNANQQSVASALSTMSVTKDKLLEVIAPAPVSGLAAIYNNLSPEIHAAASDSLLQNSHYVRDAVLQNHQPDNQVWITTWGHGGHSQGDRQYTDSPVSNQGWGVAVGSDVALAKHVTGGLMAGYERTTVSGRDASDARARINAAHIGAYLRADLNSVNLNGGLIYSFLDQNTYRHININTLQGKLNNDNSGHQVQLFAELNRDFRLATSTTLIPYVNVAHVWQMMGESSEKALGNAGPAAVHMDRDNKGVTFTGLGLRGVITLPTAVPASLQFAAGWQHAFGDTHSAINSYFAGNTERISTHGTGLARDSALINTGLNIKTSASSSLTISYQGEFGAGHTDNAGKLQWQLQF